MSGINSSDTFLRDFICGIKLYGEVVELAPDTAHSSIKDQQFAVRKVNTSAHVFCIVHHIFAESLCLIEQWHGKWCSLQINSSINYYNMCVG